MSDVDRVHADHILQHRCDLCLFLSLCLPLTHTTRNIPHHTMACRYEKEPRLGGRAYTVALDDNEQQLLIELGASIIHIENDLILTMARAANLTPVPVDQDGDGLLALFDGVSLVFRQSPWRIITFIKTLWRYGFQPWFYRNSAYNFLHKFRTIYDLQANGTSFVSVHDMLKSIACHTLTQEVFVQYIRDTFHTYSTFAAEIVAAASKTNYNQNNMELNAFAGLVSLLPATDPRVVRIKEGNTKIAETVIEHVVDGGNGKGSIYLNTTVVEIVQKATTATSGAGEHEKKTFTVVATTTSSSSSTNTTTTTTTNNNNNNNNLKEGEEREYDAVIIATPVQSTTAPIQLSNIPHLPVIPHRAYQQTIVTIIRGTLRPTFFGLPPGPFPYSTILVTESGTNVPFTSISRVGMCKGTGMNNVYYYKLFSRQSLPQTWLGMIFDGGYQILVTRTWEAYPRFDAPENFPPFKLSEGLYYSSAWENAASAMEMASLAGRNVALLVNEYLSAKQRQHRGADILVSRGRQSGGNGDAILSSM